MSLSLPVMRGGHNSPVNFCIVSTMADTTEEDRDDEYSRRRSSFFGRSRMSFFRNGGVTSATVDHLRGTQGAHFEGSGKVTRGYAGIFTCVFCCTGETNKVRYLLVKGPFCFVFVTKDDSAPKYAVALQSMKANTKSNASSVVVLESELGDVEYEFAFNDVEIAREFMKAVDEVSKSAQVEDVRKRLGHGHLISKRSSLIYAETVARAKVSDQPPTPLTNIELSSGEPHL